MNEYHDDTDRQKQEQDEHEAWLTEQERQTVENLEEHMNRMFEKLFGGKDDAITDL